MSIRQSKTTHNLLTELQQVKQNKETIVTKLASRIERNTELIEDAPTLRIGYKHKVFAKRDKSVDFL